MASQFRVAFPGLVRTLQAAQMAAEAVSVLKPSQKLGLQTPPRSPGLIFGAFLELEIFVASMGSKIIIFLFILATALCLLLDYTTRLSVRLVYAMHAATPSFVEFQ